MKPIIETKRLILREFQKTDAKNMYALNLDKKVLKYTGDKAFKSVEDAANFLKNYSDYSKNGFGRWSVFLKSTNTYIGWCGLKLNEEGFVDIGFRLLQKYWHNGYATEAAEACIDYGFGTLKLSEIIGRAAIANKASIKVLEKIGLHFWKKDTFEGVNEAVYYKITKKLKNENIYKNRR